MAEAAAEPMVALKAKDALKDIGKNVAAMAKTAGSKIDAIVKSTGITSKILTVGKRGRKLLQKHTEEFHQLYKKQQKSKVNKLKDKLTEFYNNVFIKGKWFRRVVAGLHNIVTSNAGWIIKLLKFLMVLAVLDPKGKFLTAIIKFVLKFAVYIISAIAKALPAFIQVIVELVPVLVRILGKALLEIGDALSAMFTKFASVAFFKGTIIGDLFNFLAWLVGNQGPIQGMIKGLMQFFKDLTNPKISFGEAIGKLVRTIVGELVRFLQRAVPLLIEMAGKIIFEVIPAIIAVLWLTISGLMDGLFGKDSALASVFKTLAVVIGAAVILLKLYALFHMAKNSVELAWIAIRMMDPTILIIMALVAAFIIIWIWKDKIVGFFETLAEWFSKLSIVGKILVGALVILFWPIAAIALAIYGLAKLFQHFAKHGFSKGLAMIWEAIKKFFWVVIDGIVWVGKKIGAGIMWLLDWIITIFKWAAIIIGALLLLPFWPLITMIYGIYRLVKWLMTIDWGELFSKIFTSILELASMAWLWVKNIVKKVWKFAGKMWKKVSGIFSGLGNLFNNMMNNLGEAFSWDNIKKSMIKMIDKFVDVFKSTMIGAVKLIQGIAKKVWKNIRDAFGGIGSLFKALWLTIKSKLTSMPTMTMGQASRAAMAAESISGVDTERIMKLARGKLSLEDEDVTARERALIAHMKSQGMGITSGNTAEKIIKHLEKIAEKPPIELKKGHIPAKYRRKKKAQLIPDESYS